MKHKNKKFKIGLIQIALSKDTDKNLQKAINWISKAARKGAQVICLPELFRSQYFCQSENIDYFELAETIPGSSTEAISKVAKQNKVVVIVPVLKREPWVFTITRLL